MSADPDSLDHTLALMVHQDLLTMVEYEKRLRKQLLALGMHQKIEKYISLIHITCG